MATETRVAGLSSEEPTVENELGGKQSAMKYRIDVIPHEAIFEMGEIIAGGTGKYGLDNWRAITVREHLAHALQHIFGFLAGDKSEAKGAITHLGHAACRICFAVAVYKQGGAYTKRWVDEVHTPAMPGLEVNQEVMDWTTASREADRTERR